MVNPLAPPPRLVLPSYTASNAERKEGPSFINGLSVVSLNKEHLLDVQNKYSPHLFSFIPTDRPSLPPAHKLLALGCLMLSKHRQIVRSLVPDKRNYKDIFVAINELNTKHGALEALDRASTGMFNSIQLEMKKISGYIQEGNILELNRRHPEAVYAAYITYLSKCDLAHKQLALSCLLLSAHHQLEGRLVESNIISANDTKGVFGAILNPDTLGKPTTTRTSTERFTGIQFEMKKISGYIKKGNIPELNHRHPEAVYHACTVCLSQLLKELEAQFGLCAGSDRQLLDSLVAQKITDVDTITKACSSINTPARLGTAGLEVKESRPPIKGKNSSDSERPEAAHTYARRLSNYVKDLQFHLYSLILSEHYRLAFRLIDEKNKIIDENFIKNTFSATSNSGGKSGDSEKKFDQLIEDMHLEMNESLEFIIEGGIREESKLSQEAVYHAYASYLPRLANDERLRALQSLMFSDYSTLLDLLIKNKIVNKDDIEKISSDLNNAGPTSEACTDRIKRTRSEMQAVLACIGSENISLLGKLDAGIVYLFYARYLQFQNHGQLEMQALYHLLLSSHQGLVEPLIENNILREQHLEIVFKIIRRFKDPAPNLALIIRRSITSKSNFIFDYFKKKGFPFVDEGDFIEWLELCIKYKRAHRLYTLLPIEYYKDPVKSWIQNLFDAFDKEPGSLGDAKSNEKSDSQKLQLNQELQEGDSVASDRILFLLLSDFNTIAEGKEGDSLLTENQKKNISQMAISRGFSSVFDHFLRKKAYSAQIDHWADLCVQHNRSFFLEKILEQEEYEKLQVAQKQKIYHSCKNLPYFQNLSIAKKLKLFPEFALQILERHQLSPLSQAASEVFSFVIENSNSPLAKTLLIRYAQHIQPDLPRKFLHYAVQKKDRELIAFLVQRFTRSCYERPLVRSILSLGLEQDWRLVKTVLEAYPYFTTYLFCVIIAVVVSVKSIFLGLAGFAQQLFPPKNSI